MLQFSINSYLATGSISVTLFDLPQNTKNDKTRQLSSKANKSGEEAQKETMKLIDIGLTQSNK